MLKRRLARLGWIFSEKFGLLLLSMLSFYAYALLLTAEQLGVAVVLIATVEAIALIYTSMVEDPLVRLDQLHREQVATVFWAGLAISVMTVVLLAAGTILYTTESTYRWMMVVTAIKIPMVMASRIYVAELRRQGNFKALASRTLLGKVVASIAGVSAAMAGWGSWAVIIQAVAMEAISLAVLMVRDRRPIPVTVNYAFLRSLLRDGAPVALKAVSWDLMNRGVNLVLGATAGAAAVGVFNLASRIVNLPAAAIFNGLLSYALPVYARRKGDEQALRRLFCRSTELTSLLLVPGFLGLAVVAEDLVLTVFGAKWASAVPVLQIVAVMTALNSTLLYAYAAFMAVAKTHLTIKAEMVTAVLAVAVVYVTAGSYGAMAGAVALFARFLLMVPANLRGLNRAIGLTGTLFLSSIYRCGLASSAMVGAIWLLYGYGGLAGGKRLLMAIVVGISVYFVCYTLLRRSWFADLTDFLSDR